MQKSKKTIKNNMFVLTDQYIKFRFGKLSLNDWYKKGKPIIDECAFLDPAEPLYGLMSSHAYLLMSKSDKAKKILDTFDKNKEELLEYSPVEYSYFLYLQCIYKKHDKNLLIKASEKLDQIVKTQSQDWRIHWFRLQIDEKFRKNITESYNLLNNVFDKGCKSPVMYFEACNLLNNHSDKLFNKLDDFEIQVIHWGVRHSFIKQGLIQQLVELTTIRLTYSPILFSTLVKLYKHYKYKKLLKSICYLLVRGKKTDANSFKWYQLSKKENIIVPDLNEYYLKSCDKSDLSPLPEDIVRYFINNTNISDEEKNYFYANILKNNSGNYIKQIIAFAEDQISKGNIDKNLAYIYQKLYKSDLLQKELINKFLDLIFSCEISCINPTIREVIIVHSEKEEEIKNKFKNGKVLVEIYTDNYFICFVNEKGYRYLEGIDYYITPFFEEKDFLEKVYKEGYRNETIAMHLCQRAVDYQRVDDFAIELYSDVLKYEGTTNDFKTAIITLLARYYYDNNKMEELKKAIDNINFDYARKQTRVELIEYMIVLGLNEEALNMIEAYGYNLINVKKLYKLCDALLDIDINKPILKDICNYLFNENNYNEKIVNYLLVNATGSLDELYNLWKQAKKFNLNTNGLEEKILQQALYTQMFSKKYMEVFEEYYLSNKTTEISKTYLDYFAYQYLMLDYNMSDFICECIKEQVKQSSADMIHQYALLKYLSFREILSDDEKVWVISIIKECIEEQRVLPWFRRFANKIELPSEIRERAFIEYEAKPDTTIIMHYRLENDKKYTSIIMKHIGFGIYIANFMMFYNEHLQYYIEEKSQKGACKITLNNVYVHSAEETAKDPTCYDLINTMIMSKFMNDDSTMEKAVEEFIDKSWMIKKRFSAY